MPRSGLFPLLLALGIGLLPVSGAVSRATAAPARLDPALTAGPEACSKCHDREFAVWKGTAHARLYASDKPLHQRPRAQQIAKNLNIPLIKVDSLCLDCHFTPRLLSGKTLAGAGVSCEHCHGAARDWISVHNTFEGRQVDRRTETADQRRRRWERNVSIGMRSGANLYDLLSSCYRCHLVPDERLVNAGGHVTGGEIDLPARFDAIRHNFVRGQRKENAPVSPERKRQLYVLGLSLELENSLRGLAAAKQDGDYANGLAERIEDTRKRLRKAAQQGGLPQITAALSSVDGLRLAAGNAAELDAAVRRISTAARTFAEQEDGSRLAALDPLLQPQEEEEPPPDETASGEAEDDEEVAGAEPGASAGGPAGAGPGTRPAAGPASGPTSGTTARPAGSSGSAGSSGPAGPAGKLRQHIREPFPRGAIKGHTSCQAACHREQIDKWRREAHFRTAEPFENGDTAALRIATLYYGKPANDLLATGTTVCMDCHGTVKGGNIEAGVSCESCHGPAGAFFEPHKSAANRAARIQAGIVDLENPARRAEVCASCHYMTDPRLLASGHPVPKPFDLWERSEKIRHWKGGPDAGALRAAFQQAAAKRGAVPQVQVAKLTQPLAASPGTRAPAAGPSALLPGGAAAARRMGAVNGRPPAPRPYAQPSGPTSSGGSGGSTPGRRVDLPPLPEGADKLPVDQVLKLIQERLKALYEQTGGGE